MYKVGDKARVKKNLKVGKMYGNYTFYNGMKEYKGKVITISYKDDRGYYRCEEQEQLVWSNSMLEPIKENKEKMDIIEALTWLKDQPKGTSVESDNKKIIRKPNGIKVEGTSLGYYDFEVMYTKPKKLISFNEFMQKTFEKFIIVKSKIGKYYGTRCDNTKCSECFFKDINNCDVGDLENITKEEFEGKFEIIFEKEINNG